MYVPAHFRVEEREALRAFVRAHDFATLISVVDGAPLVSHVPLLLRTDAEGADTLYGHVARANPHARCFDGATPALAIFHGAHGYVSPSWYSAAPAVPTWNYEVVHASGTPRVLEDAELADLLAALAAVYEEPRPQPWRFAELPADYAAKMTRAIVGFALPVETLTGKFKLSQNKPAGDVERVIAALEHENPALAAAMRARR